MGDVKTGGDGIHDDERIMVELHKIPARIGRILFVVTIHEAEQRGVNFGATVRAYARLVDEGNNNDELIRIDLKGRFSSMTAVVVAEIHRNSRGGWNYKTIGDGMTGSFNGVCKRVGVVNIVNI